jgi:hypothetical protein
LLYVMHRLDTLLLAPILTAGALALVQARKQALQEGPPAASADPTSSPSVSSSSTSDLVSSTADDEEASIEQAVIDDQRVMQSSPSPSPEELHGAVVFATSTDDAIVERTPVQDEEMPASYSTFDDEVLIDLHGSGAHLPPNTLPSTSSNNDSTVPDT